mmetsp:Transcript_20433/g.59162  ORF Transcript_20433/g.59162 Transcript_20433/m.59162 type:complete len:221 (+) Transcript_20433:739-1401(+)
MTSSSATTTRKGHVTLPNSSWIPFDNSTHVDAERTIIFPDPPPPAECSSHSSLLAGSRYCFSESVLEDGTTSQSGATRDSARRAQRDGDPTERRSIGASRTTPATGGGDGDLPSPPIPFILLATERAMVPPMLDPSRNSFAGHASPPSSSPPSSKWRTLAYSATAAQSSINSSAEGSNPSTPSDSPWPGRSGARIEYPSDARRSAAYRTVGYRPRARKPW